MAGNRRIHCQHLLQEMIFTKSFLLHSMRNWQLSLPMIRLSKLFAEYIYKISGHKNTGRPLNGEWDHRMEMNIIVLNNSCPEN